MFSVFGEITLGSAAILANIPYFLRAQVAFGDATACCRFAELLKTFVFSVFPLKRQQAATPKASPHK